MTPAQLEQLAGAINQLSAGLADARRILTDDALVVLLADACGLNKTSMRTVLRAIDELPEHVLTPHARGIRLRD